MGKLYLEKKELLSKLNKLRRMASNSNITDEELFRKYESLMHFAVRYKKATGDLDYYAIRYFEKVGRGEISRKIIEDRKKDNKIVSKFYEDLFREIYSKYRNSHK